MDAKDTVGSVMKFIDADSTQQVDKRTVDGSKLMEGRAGLTEYLQRQDVEVINWDQFLKIEAAEADRSRLRSDVQPREKILSVKEMLNAAS